MTSGYHGGTISGSQPSFLMEEKYGLTVLFLSANMHWKVIHVNFFSFFQVLPYLQDHGSLRSRNFATVATRGSDFSSLIPTLKGTNRGGRGGGRTYFVTLGLRRMDYTVMATNTIRRETNMYDKIKSICFHKLRRIED